MPFYRSIVGGSGGGGGSSCVTFETTGDEPLLSIAGFKSNDDTEISKVSLGNQISNAYGFIDGDYYNHLNFDASIDLSDAEHLSIADYFLANCNNYNSPVTFPNNTYAHWEVGYYGQESYRVSYDSFFYNDTNYNCSTTIKCHEINSAGNKPTWILLNNLFMGCENYNARTVFDFDKLNKSDANNSIIKYSCYSLFYDCYNFSQPLIFPSGLDDISNAFYGCYNYNQPVVFNLYSTNDIYIDYYGFSYLFAESPFMTSDIIFINSNNMGNHGVNFNSIVCEYNASDEYCRNNWINIYIENTNEILNCNVSNNQTLNYSDWTKTYDSTKECYVYSNSTIHVNIYDSVSYALNNFNNYYYDLYGEYPVY